MIHLVEGPNGVGKTTFARHLAKALRVPYVEDLAKRRVEVVDREAVFVAYVSILEQIAADVDLVSDRGWISTIAFCRLFNRPVPGFLQVPVVRARRFEAVETIYRVDVPLETALRRIHQRGESVDGDLLGREFEIFDDLFAELYVDGIKVVNVLGDNR